ncbi:MULTISPECIES: hypothetical protein [Pseudomonas]|uniref:hypothetical protein n=1 Tax=Pseudomonas TaxID=286 RepID=UPI000D010D82|nr:MULTISPECIES: hypothetical protein [Pseudomonas]PRA40701.1 hypothetical protein CQZ98_28505 [Pseudomonas sp. MYb115]QXN52776.1 hypothetical protein KW062_14030 [Pseudomonas fluorescens]WSO27119.1 hypothetical protein VUJ50_14105 [Pseudomonas fluorescens]
MTAANPAPKVPLNADNALDLDQLGSRNLVTHVYFPGIDAAKGGFIYPNWRGCTASGDAGDNFDNAWPIDDTLVPEGLPIEFPNALLKDLDQGWVFYSYTVQLPGEPLPSPDESKRLFFYVGVRASATTQLPVPQIKQSHGLELDADRNVLPSNGVSVSVPPYAAMGEGDKVTLKWVGFTETGARRPLSPVWTVTNADVGRPLTRLVGRTDVMLLEKGRLELHYEVAYAGGGNVTISAQQNFRIVPPTQPYLPAPVIDRHGGGPLDPELFPDGITVRITLYPGALSGDVVTLYSSVAADIGAHVSIRIDPSTIDSGVLTFHLDHAWLLSNNGKSAELLYQYARSGQSLAGDPLSLLIRKPLELPLPEIANTAQEPGDDPNERMMDAGVTTAGSQASVPDGAVIGANDSVHLHWGKPGEPGHVAIPVAADRKTFTIPKNAIAMHMGAGEGARERLSVYYRVVPSGEPAENYQDSKFVYLKVKPFPQNRFPTIQCELAQGTGGKLSLGLITDPRGAKYNLAQWSYLHEGQILNIKVINKDHYLLKDYVVTAADVGKVKESWLAKDFLVNQVGLNNKFKVSVTVSFDGGRTHLSFPDSPELTLIN